MPGYRIIRLQYHTSGFPGPKAQRQDGSRTANFLAVRDTWDQSEHICTDEQRESTEDWLWKTAVFLAEYLNELGKDGWKVVCQMDGYNGKQLVLMAGA